MRNVVRIRRGRPGVSSPIGISSAVRRTNSRGEFDVLATLRRSGAPYELTAGEIGESTMVTRRAAETDAHGRLISLTDCGPA